jgi:hypothetical protein
MKSSSERYNQLENRKVQAAALLEQKSMNNNGSSIYVAFIPPETEQKRRDSERSFSQIFETSGRAGQWRKQKMTVALRSPCQYD